MHRHAEVWVSDNKNVEELVEKIMSPYSEEGDNPEAFWDWYQIGGRWKGSHVPEYDAEKDSNHKRTCSLCNGTGRRPNANRFEELHPGWIKSTNGCNGCYGTGVETTWPTEWKPHPKDIISVNEVKDTLDCYILVLPNEILVREKWNGKSFEKTEFNGNVSKELNRRKISSGYLVTVDCHN